MASPVHEHQHKIEHSTTHYVPIGYKATWDFSTAGPQHKLNGQFDSNKMVASKNRSEGILQGSTMLALMEIVRRSY